MKHLFRATKLGWAQEQEGVWFDTNEYTKEEAKSQFNRYEGTTQKGYPYTGFEYDGQKYHDVTYLGEFEDDKLPKDTNGLIDMILKGVVKAIAERL